MNNIMLISSTISKSQENISKHDIKKYQTECKLCLTDVNNRMKQCINTFNNISLDLSKIMVKLLPDDDDTSKANKLLIELVKLKPAEPIALFIDKVYSVDEYRTSIKAGNDNFFLEKNHHKVTNGDTDKINKLFKFKKCWSALDDEIKDMIKNMMKVLVNLTAKYIEELDNGNEIALLMKKIDMIK